MPGVVGDTGFLLQTPKTQEAGLEGSGCSLQGGPLKAAALGGALEKGPAGHPGVSYPSPRPSPSRLLLGRQAIPESPQPSPRREAETARGSQRAWRSQPLEERGLEAAVDTGSRGAAAPCSKQGPSH